MDELAEHIKQMKIRNYAVGDKIKVDITHIENPVNFYARPFEYRNYLPTLTSYGDIYPLKDLKESTFVIFRSKVADKYARGRVLTLRKNDERLTVADIYALDYGFYETNVIAGTLHIPSLKTNIPPLAMKCALTDCMPLSDSWTREATETVRVLLADDPATMTIRKISNNRFIVDLSNKICPDDFSTMLAYSGHSAFGVRESDYQMSPTKTFRDYFRYPTFQVGQKLHVRVVSGSTLESFHVAKVDDYKKYLINKEKLSYDAKKRPKLTPDKVVEGMPVAILLIASNKFERGYVDSITMPNEQVKVALVDCGRQFEVPYNRLTAMIEPFFNQPVVAIYCKADEKQAWEHKRYQFLYSGLEMYITIKEVGDIINTPYYVDISQIEPPQPVAVKTLAEANAELQAELQAEPQDEACAEPQAKPQHEAEPEQN